MVYYRALARTPRLTPSASPLGLTLSLAVPFPSPPLSFPTHPTPHTPRHPLVPNPARTSSSGPHHDSRRPSTHPPRRGHVAPPLDAVLISRSFRPAEHCTCTAPATAPFPTIILGSPRPGSGIATFRPPPPAAGEREPASPAASSTPSHAKLVSHYCTPCKNIPRHPISYTSRTSPTLSTHPPVTGSPSRAPSYKRTTPVRLSVFSERKVPAANDIDIEFEARTQDTTRHDTTRQETLAPRFLLPHPPLPSLPAPTPSSGTPAPHPPPGTQIRHSALDPTRSKQPQNARPCPAKCPHPPNHLDEHGNPHAAARRPTRPQPAPSSASAP